MLSTALPDFAVYVRRDGIVRRLGVMESVAGKDFSSKGGGGPVLMLHLLYLVYYPFFLLLQGVAGG